MNTKIAVQLYGMREEGKTDLKKVLAHCAQLGFDGVEFAGLYGNSSTQVKQWLDQYGLEVPSSHVSLQLLTENLEETLAQYREIGCKRIVIPYYKAEDEQSTQELIEIVRKLSPTLKEQGFELYYHNHRNELNRVGDHTILDCLCEAFSPDQLKLEVDTYWVFAAGVDPCTFLEEHKDHIDIVHLKDGKALTPCTWGEGEGPVKDVLKKTYGTAPWVILENDCPIPDGLSDTARSMANIKKALEK